MPIPPYPSTGPGVLPFTSFQDEVDALHNAELPSADMLRQLMGGGYEVMSMMERQFASILDENAQLMEDFGLTPAMVLSAITMLLTPVMRRHTSMSLSVTNRAARAAMAEWDGQGPLPEPFQVYVATVAMHLRGWQSMVVAPNHTRASVDHAVNMLATVHDLLAVMGPNGMRGPWDGPEGGGRGDGEGG